MHAAKGGGGVAQMRAQYISLCSNNDVILRARGEWGSKRSKTCVHTKSMLPMFDVILVFGRYYDVCLLLTILLLHPLISFNDNKL